MMAKIVKGKAAVRQGNVYYILDWVLRLGNSWRGY